MARNVPIAAHVEGAAHDRGELRRFQWCSMPPQALEQRLAHGGCLTPDLGQLRSAGEVVERPGRRAQRTRGRPSRSPSRPPRSQPRRARPQAAHARREDRLVPRRFQLPCDPFAPRSISLGVADENREGLGDVLPWICFCDFYAMIHRYHLRVVLGDFPIGSESAIEAQSGVPTGLAQVIEGQSGVPTGLERAFGPPSADSAISSANPSFDCQPVQPHGAGSRLDRVPAVLTGASPSMQRGHIHSTPNALNAASRGSE